VKEDARRARNARALKELHPAFGRRVSQIIAALERLHYRPRIQDAWRSPQAQLEAFNAGNSRLEFGFHNVTGANGEAEALAVDLLDDDFPLNPRRDYLLRRAAAATDVSCRTGVAWGLPPNLAAAVEAAVASGQWNAKVKIGWDPTHVEPVDVTLAQAAAGRRPADTAARAVSPVGSRAQAKAKRRMSRKPRRNRVKKRQTKKSSGGRKSSRS
jgi:hypothetical protein